jgi:hypothetical protein
MRCDYQFAAHTTKNSPRLVSEHHGVAALAHVRMGFVNSLAFGAVSAMQKLALIAVDRGNQDTRRPAPHSSADGKTGLAPHTIGPVIKAAETIYAAFASRFKREMPQPVITVQSGGRSRARAWFWADQWQSPAKRRIPEINLCAEYINGGLAELANSVLHEMTHYANWLDGVRDCSADQYHNRRFKSRCESVGLVCERHPQQRYGWAVTRLSPEVAQLVRALGIDERALNLHRIVSPPVTQTGGSKLKKWSCRCTNVWAAVEVAALCVRCRQRFDSASK